MKKKKQNIISKTFSNLFIKPLKQEISKELKTLNKKEIVKEVVIEKELSTPAERENTTIQSQLMQFNVNPSYFNSVMRPNIKDKPEGYINPIVLRSFSIDYPIARACIDFIKTKTTQLNWEIVKTEEEDTLTNDDLVRKNIEEFFKKPSGQGSSMRLFLEQIIEDYLVMGSVTIEKLRTRGGKILHLLPVDAGTIKVRVDESGRLPQSPSIAFEQWIRGMKTAELTQDDLIFAVKNARPNTIFGLSPLESLVIQVQSALAGSLYNWKFFTDSNQAEGFIEVPQEWTKDQVAEFQAYFDAMIAGDPRYQRRLKMMPGGMKYTPTKKPEDMAFERFELWLLQQTCSVFGVTPQSLGFTQQVNKATAEVQGDITQERVGRGLQQFIEELFTNLIQYDMGYVDYKFKFVNTDPTDLLEEAQIEDIKIRNGTLSVDEVRRRNGMEEIGLTHFVMTGQGPMLIEDILERETEATPTTTNQRRTQVVEQEDMEDMEDDMEEDEMERKELAQWKKFCINAIKAEGSHKDFNEFTVKYIKSDKEIEIRKQLEVADDKADIVKIFQYYLNNDYKQIMELRKMFDEISK
jgi:HK97 family phage portal protein